MTPVRGNQIPVRRTPFRHRRFAAAVVPTLVLLMHLPAGANASSRLALAPARAQTENNGRAAQYREKFEHQTDAVHRAKLMRKLGKAEFQDIGDEMVAGHVNQALVGLQQYLDQARTVEDGLDARRVNAENHPSGFKELQFSLRDSLLRLDQMISGIPASQQPPFLSIKKDLDELNRHLIRELFPRQPAAGESTPNTTPGKS